MKKSTTRIAIVVAILIVMVVGYYALLSSRKAAERTDPSMTFVESTLSRNLENNYPSTPKEVLKYYNDIQKCFYNEECTEEQIDGLILKARDLYDAELLEQNSLAVQTIRLKQEIQDYKDKNRKLIGISLAASANVVFDKVDGNEFAKIHCVYNILEGSTGKPTTQVFLLRRDADRKWKIYGWKIQDEESQQGGE